VRDTVTARAGATIFKPATGNCGLDQPVLGARNFICRVTGGYGLDQPTPVAPAFSAKEAQPSTSGEKAKSSAQPEH
jgi:hypothetical protein